MAKTHPLSLLEELSLALTVIFILIRTPFATLQTFYHRGDFTIKGLKRARLIATGRNASSIPLHQTRTLIPPTGVAISTYCKKNSISHTIHKLDPTLDKQPGILHFIGCSPDDKAPVLLYFHGGGYVFPLQSASQLAFARRATEAANTKLVLLEYGLAPEMQYPGQLKQGVSALNWLLQRHAAGDILVGGDSAGGNLALGLLAHVLKPHPNITPINLSKGEKFRGMFCISPRTVNETTAPSFTRNSKKDIISRESTKFFRASWKPVAGEIWAAPALVEKNLWSDIPVKRIILLAGADEVHVDDIRDFGAKIGAEERADASRQLVVCEGEFHDQCTLDLSLGIDDSRMIRAAMAWLASLNT